MTSEVMQPIHSNIRVTRWLMSLALMLVLSPALSAHGFDTSDKDHPAYVEGSQFLDLIDPKGTLIEVNLSRRLIKIFCGRAIKKREPVIADILDDLVSFKAIIGDVNEETQEDVEEEMSRIREKLDGSEWERFVRVRDDGDEYAAFIHIDEDDEELINGLLVLGFIDEGKGKKIIFVNLVGTIDMENIALLGDHMNIPGLEALPPMSEIKRDKSARSDDEEPESSNEDPLYSRRDLE
ncbi:MAG: DUF4252 domain-containing protein [Planctomycetota bacterium]|nr:DUF4252 domain-containing protein [Planctomycetota bacterium]